jgi:EAL domain-containing protein (putative c-di-GMP-specific phosphodiesterase class I)
MKVILEDSLKLIKNKNKRVSINISYDDILNEETTKHIYNLLDENIDYASNIEFEILESEEISDFNLVDVFIDNVSRYGIVKLELMTLVAGYSNFHLLSRLDIDFIKIDGSLIEKYSPLQKI